MSTTPSQVGADLEELPSITTAVFSPDNVHEDITGKFANNEKKLNSVKIEKKKVSFRKNYRE